MNGSELKNLLDSYEIQQKELALLLGVSTVTVSRWVNGVGEIPRHEAETIELKLQAAEIKKIKGEELSRCSLELHNDSSYVGGIVFFEGGAPVDFRNKKYEVKK